MTKGRILLVTNKQDRAKLLLFVMYLYACAVVTSVPFDSLFVSLFGLLQDANDV
jgi:hypothetical protein